MMPTGCDSEGSRSGSLENLRWSDELEALHEESSRDHFIDVHTRWALRRAIPPDVTAGGVVLDVGCSSGYLVEDLRRDAPRTMVVGVDMLPAGPRRARASMPDASLLVADSTCLPVADATVDALVSANMLEHVEDDLLPLREFLRVLRPGGIAAIVVPAGPGLFDAYDAHLGHYRRYARRELASRASTAGFEVVEDSYLGSVVFPAFWAVKKRNRWRASNAGEDARRRIVAADIAKTKDSLLGRWAMAAERRLLRHGVNIPFGVRSCCVLRRPR
jgi:ubiquinone/menaquinone biosynthesis C-methylase UbiE